MAEFTFEYESNLMHNVYDKGSRSLCVNHSGSDAIFGKKAGDTYVYWGHFDESCKGFKDNVFDAEDDPENTRYLSVIFPLTESAGKDIKFKENIKEYLKPIAADIPKLDAEDKKN